MNDDLEGKVEELEDLLETEKKLRVQDKKAFEERLAAVEKTLKEHAHQEGDGSAKLQRHIDLLPFQSLGAGSCAGLTGAPIKETGRDESQLLLIAGRDQTLADGFQNTELVLVHQHDTDGTTNQSFFDGFRGPFYQGTTGKITSAGTTMRQSDWVWETNELDGAFLMVRDEGTTEYDVFEIASNDEDTITITGGTWTFSQTNAVFEIFMPVYLGSATRPWRRAYIMQGTEGGLRIGPGDTAGGQNGLLYMDSAGDLYWRNKTGTSTKLN